MAKKAKKPLTQTEIQHQKFLKKMGVSPKQLKARKQARENDENGIPNLKFDTCHSIAKVYDNE